MNNGSNGFRQALDASGAAAAASRLVRSPVYWLFVVLFAGYQAINASIAVRSMDVAPWKPVVWEFSSVLVMGLLIPLVVGLERLVPIDARRRSRAVALHVAAMLLFSVVHVAGMLALRKPAYALAGLSYSIRGALDPFWLGFLYELQKDALTYAAIVSICLLVRTWRGHRERERRALMLERDLADARLAQLTAQIEPHFLFNVLNAIANRMHENVESADRMMARLGDLLRRTFEQGTATRAPLGAEIAWLEDYLELMQERFRGRLVADVEAAEDVRAVLVPRLLLQPLVENALKHGLADGGGRLRIAVSRVGDRLRCEVADDGRGGAVGAARGTGLGNVARRLELLFPGQHEFVIADRAGGGTSVTIEFPVEQP
jgi:two-component system, LytTR family, sensor kinase